VNVTFTSLGSKRVTLTIVKNGCVQTRIVPTQVVNCSAAYGDIIALIASVTNNKKVKLDWITANETKNSKYVVEKSDDGFSFKAIGTVASQNNVHNVYNFTDNAPKMGRSFYRIHQLSTLDEEIRLSKVEKVIVGDGELSMLVYPNPIDKTVFVEVLNGENTEGSLEVYNALGVLVRTQYFTKNQVRYELELGELAAGNYIVRIRQNDGQTATAKMTKM
jgi:Secretion system C-terminal sorting domain